MALPARFALALLIATTGDQASAQVPPMTPRLRGPVVAGTVRAAAGGAPLARARVTLFTPGLGFFRERRTRAGGSYAFLSLPPGVYRLGVAAPGFEYEEIPVQAGPGLALRDFDLDPEKHAGSWAVIGTTAPETFDATDIGALRPDGFVLFCHDTTDPILFHPATGQKIPGPASGSEQGCMNTTLLADGSVLLCGGQDGAAPGNFTNAIPWVKGFRPGNAWQQLPSMLLAAGRWYPGLARLNDGRVLIMGGGTAPSAQRTDTCEILDPETSTWTFTDTMGSALEFPPAALLHNGLVLRTWGSRPQLFDPAAELWSDTGDMVFPGRGWPGHSDHSLLVLTDGRALAVGIRTSLQATAEMTELYDPGTGKWTAGTSPSLKRMQPEVVYLPDGRVLVQGGEASNPVVPNVLGLVQRTDLLDPATGTWRQVADTLQFREYHAVTLLVPDGRVMTTGGTTIKFQVGPTSADIDAYSPPYLFRGVRPKLSNLSDASPGRGVTITFDVAPRTRLTAAVLMGVQSTTHWVDGGIPRRLELGVAQANQSASVALPSDPDLLPLGWYLLFGLVDDIPSEALMLRVDP